MHGGVEPPRDREDDGHAGHGEAAEIVYVPNDDGAGHGAIHWAQEGNVDNFVYAAGKDAIVHNVQGYHMPGAVLYQRCKP